MSDKVTERELVDMAKKFPIKELKYFAIEMGITSIDYDHICNDNKSAIDIIFQVLKRLQYQTNLREEVRKIIRPFRHQISIEQPKQKSK